MRRIGTASLAITLTTGLSFVLAGGEAVDLGGLKSTAPAAWKRQAPSNRLRKAQFMIPKADGDKENAELVVFFFGKGGGGSNDDNIKRWKGQFIPPEGKTADEATKVEKFKIGKVADIVYVDQQGTFKSRFPPNAPNAKEVRKERFRRISVIFDSDEGPFFITLTGPAKTVQKNKAAFDGWIKAFK